MKKVAILSNYGDSFSVSEELIFAYSELTHTFRANGLDLKRVSIHSFDKERGIFLDYVDLDTDGEFKIFHEDYRPDVVWNRSGDGQVFANFLFESLAIRSFPESSIMTIACDKYETYLFLKQFQPKTILLGEFFQKESIRQSLSEKVVLKPIRSDSGKGISFPTQEELMKSESTYEGLGSLFIVQSFLDFSAGIPGMVEGMHDIRLVFIDGKISHSTIRVPAPGSLKSNVGACGSQKLLNISDIPEDLLKIAADVILNLPFQKQEIFSIDFGYVLSEKRWYVFEINDTPGVYCDPKDPEEEKIFCKQYFSNIVAFIKKSFFNT